MKKNESKQEFSAPQRPDLSKRFEKEIPLESIVEIINFISKTYQDKDKKLEEISKHCTRK
jgi:hypothetical protein